MMVSLPLPRNCSFLWCMGLRVGTKVISSLHLLVSLALMITCACLASTFRGNVGTVEDVDGLYTHWHTLTTVAAVFSAAHVALASLLYVAAHKQMRILVLVWVWIMLVLWTTSLIMTVVFFRYNSSLYYVIVSLLQIIASYGFMMYCIICVHSYYCVLEDDCKAEDDDPAAKPL